MENSTVIILPELSMFFNTMHSQSGDGQTALLPCLHAVQDLYGCISSEIIEEISHNLEIPVLEINELIDFYPQFRRTSDKKTVLHICNDPACKLAGADTIFKTIRNPGNIIAGEETRFVEKAPCLGLCAHSPTLYIQRDLLRFQIENQNQYQAVSTRKYSRTEILGSVRRITRRCGKGKTNGLMEYWSDEGYQALKRALSMSSEMIIEEVKASGLTGRGGDSFLTGIKWEKAATANHKTRYIVCNAAESDPTTYKDRVLLEEDPHSLLEGMIIAGYALQSSRGYIYVNGEYDLALKTLSRAIMDAREAGLLGKGIMGSNWNFDIDLRQGAGRYISGEETALLEAIEGKCGIPRGKPPFPTSRGLFGKPTVINNVETFCNIPIILRDGPGDFRNIGTVTSKGTILLCLTGDLNNPGLVEIPFGFTFRQLINEICGGISEDSHFQAAMVGGVIGTFLCDEDLDTVISLDHLKKAGISLGAGSIIVFNHTRNIKDILNRVSKFFISETCGKCQTCVNGIFTQVELIKRSRTEKLQECDLDNFTEVGKSMAASADCKVGKNAFNLTRSALQKWPSLFL